MIHASMQIADPLQHETGMLDVSTLPMPDAKSGTLVVRTLQSLLRYSPLRHCHYS